MATYSNPTYDSSNYQANRPQYKDSLVDFIVSYHLQTPGAETDLAVDVATGTGIFARQLQRGFKRVIGTDISEGMLQSARAVATQPPIDYVQSPAESLLFLQSQSVDVLTVATGAHWFDINGFIAEAKRVLKPSGTLAIFGYTGFVSFIDYPQCSRMLKDFGLSEDKLGTYWDDGRDVLVKGYRDYHRVLANEFWNGVSRRIYPDTIEGEPSIEYPPVIGQSPVVMDFDVTWRTLSNYLSTWSPLATYHRKYPGREAANQVLVREMMEAAGTSNIDEKLNLQWEEILVLGHPPQ
ncbi:trans-aconitate methyltransferase 1 [Coemansia thaxteri]|uniref:Trans-aconitate methyltransferase 1 n=1 Tax=Coemansia thaxteri TaxID=2663907 RepID=A0A9W8BLF3_9FUNG|nr:trans-aconitate methyltransferase 1 [Coemansia thaxteri]KAJ2007659.1 trans-aconitate methyltransferase 1 [Coemansia thaxteri]KAJ2465867.1 trans-aconitate methyltransferase 1 [Coemansia sp. RSA 2322]KAJ2485195.1 trans-aconitate methyltransferase 1 [Coemansia sp. RSA 2320]